MPREHDNEPQLSPDMPNCPSGAFRRDLVARLVSLRRFAMTLCRHPSDSEDLVQATCERALSRWHQYAPDTRLDSWLFSIMHSIWKNEQRRTGNQRRAYGVLASDTRYFDGEQAAIGKIELSEVLSGLNAISIDQAAALILVAIDGLTYREAADVLGIAQGTLESRIARGRIALGRLMEDGEDEDQDKVLPVSDTARQSRRVP